MHLTTLFGLHGKIFSTYVAIPSFYLFNLVDIFTYLEFVQMICFCQCSYQVTEDNNVDLKLIDLPCIKSSLGTQAKLSNISVY